MADVRSNEREFMSQVIFWLNSEFEKGGYPFELASSDPSVKVSAKKTRFPDVMIWINRQAGDGFCGWELKTPVTPVDDAKLLEQAAEKAQAITADYFVTWNMRDAVIWRTPRKNEKVTHLHRYWSYKAIYQVQEPDDIWVKSKQALLRARAIEILNDLSRLHTEGHLHLVDTDTTYFVKRLGEAVEKLAPYMEGALTKKSGTSREFKDALQDWAVRQGLQRYGDEAFYITTSRQIVYRVLGKIIFYNALRSFARFRGYLPELEIAGLSPKQAERKLKECFEQARQIDYQAVFEEELIDQVTLPKHAVDLLAQLLDDLNRYNFSQMPIDVIGNVFQKLIPPEERHLLGQYFTPENLVDFICAFCVQSSGDKILDPTCGSGTFLLRAYDRLKNLGQRNHKKLLPQLWGIDIAKFPAELATINLFRQNLADYDNFPRILSRDFFEVKPSEAFEFLPPKLTGEKDFQIKEKLPVFDGAIGNFPYIRQELINRSFTGYKEKLDELLAEDWYTEYTDLFTKGHKPKLSGQADIYAYLFFHTARFVKRQGGRMGFVTSNAWLDVAYGYQLQKFFLKHFKIIAILESRCEPWFEIPAVNTIVTILERCKNKEERDNHIAKFVKVKKKLSELIPYDMNLETSRRWPLLQRLVDHIEKAGSENFKLQGKKYVNTLKGLKTYEDENFRIRVKRHGELLTEVEETGNTVKWGQYLRAPKVYFEILEKCKDKLVPLKEVADVRFGIKTGINNFFYLTDEKIKHWGIEEEFLAPVLKSPKDFDAILADGAMSGLKAFLCYQSKGELRKARKHGALRYIQWGENQRTKPGQKERGGTLFPQVQSVRGRKYWYALPEQSIAKLIWVKGYHKTFKVGFTPRGALLDQELYPIYPKQPQDVSILAALLNSTLFYLCIELSGRIPFGGGVLWTTVDEAEQYTYLPHPARLTNSDKEQIQKVFNRLTRRHSKTIYDEVVMKDRQKLDSIILNALGLDPKEYLQPIYVGLCQLVSERLQLAKMRKTVKQWKEQRDTEKLKESVIEEVLPLGPKEFPKQFVTRGYLKNIKEIPVPREPLRLGHFFMGLREVVSDEGFKCQAKSDEEAKFIVYSQKPDSFIVKVPKSRIAIRNAVDKYELYVRDLKNKLIQTFFNRSHDHKLAENLTARVFEDLDIREV